MHWVSAWSMQVNDTVSFKLLKRPRDSIIPTEVEPRSDPNVTPRTTPADEDGQSSRGGPASTPHATWGVDRDLQGGETTPSQGHDKSQKRKNKDSKHRNKGNKQDAKDKYGFEGSGFNQYAKFTRVGDGKAFWKAAAEELASYAAQVSVLLCYAMLCMLCCPCCSVVCWQNNCYAVLCLHCHAVMYLPWSIALITIQ